MKVNKWTLGLAAVGLVSLPAGVQAEESGNANPVLTTLSSTQISGYVNTSAHWDLGTGNANPPLYSFNRNKQDGFNLDVVKLAIERPLDEAQWAAGYKAELIFGQDARDLATGGLDFDGESDPEEFAIKQAYVALRAPIGNGLDFKVGVFDTIIGYEVFDAGGNPNYTRSWGYTLEPTTHTGVLMSYQISDMISAAVGIANTFGPSINQRAFLNPSPDSGGNNDNNKSESYKTYMGSLALTAPEDMGFLAGSTLYAGIINGFDNNALGVGENRTHYYVGATLATPIDKLKVGAAWDYSGLHDDEDSTNVDVGGKHAYAVAAYLSFQATEKLSLHGRADYLKVSQDSVPTNGAGQQRGLAEEVVSLTGTVQYDLWASVLSRLEVRWDHQAGGHSGEAFGGESVDENHKRNAVLIAANIIYKF